MSLNMFGVYVIIKYKAEDNNPFVQITGSACIKHNDRDGFFKCGIFLAEDGALLSEGELPTEQKNNYRILLLRNRLSILQADHILHEIRNEHQRQSDVSKQKYTEMIDWRQWIYKCAEKVFMQFAVQEVPEIIETRCDQDDQHIRNNVYKNAEAVERVLEGRLLLEGELTEAVRQNIIDRPEPGQYDEDKDQNKDQGKDTTRLMITMQEQNEAVQHLLFRNQISIIPAISWDETAKTLVCSRCGSGEYIREIKCLNHAGRCWMCENCLNMGQAKGCVPMYFKAGRKSEGIHQKEVDLVWRFDLTDAQKDAAAQLLEFWHKPVGECLVWAVCGAGKTELTFPVIAEAVSHGGKVLFAIPRKDVVIDLLPRLQQAFPLEKIKALYGGSGEKFHDADIILATTHQVMRFYQAFDLIILDESDAFPYADSQMLHMAVRRALIPQGKIIFMSATPDNELQQRSLDGKMFLVTIPVRHHGYPLPLPQFIRCGDPGGNKLRDKRAVSIITELIRQSISDEGRQIFVFVPTIRLAEETGGILSRIFKGETTVNYSHSKDAQRTAKLNDFRAGIVRVLVTTAIMERGVTVPKADVLILYADYENIYDCAALVQMSGRAGRSREFPEGKVWFAAERKSAAMQKAIEAIRRMNREAHNKGYLRHDQSGRAAYLKL